MSAAVHVQVTDYEVSAMPEEHELRQTMFIKVSWRGRDTWAVLRQGAALSANGTWDWEPRASERDDEWLKTHRFERSHAIALATEAAAQLQFRGRTAAQILSDEAEEK